MSQDTPTSLPKILAGPIVRRANSKQVCFWLITNKAYHFGVKLFSVQQQMTWFDAQLNDQQFFQVQVGTHAFVNLLNANDLAGRVNPRSKLIVMRVSV